MSKQPSTITPTRRIPRSRSDSSKRFGRPIGRSPSIPRSDRTATRSTLRNWAVKGFPYLVFYIERDDHIDVWRVLHGRRDIPSRMREPEA